MFPITEDPSSGILVQCLAKNYKNDSIMSVDMDKVGVMTSYCDSVCSWLYMKIAPSLPSYTVNYTHTVRICCHNTDLVHVNGHDRIILVIFSQALYKAPWWWSLCDPKYVGAILNSFQYYIIILIVSTNYIFVHLLDNKL